MEYLEAGNLATYLHGTPPLSETDAKEVSYQILDGLCMMHENGFAHRDLKPHNILIKSHPPNGEWWMKLADFGITKRIEEGLGQYSTAKGTRRYIAPEVWGFVEQGSPYAADIRALGETVFEILAKKPSFRPRSLALHKSEQDFPATELHNTGVSQLGVGFVKSLMQPYPNDRSTAKAALADPWIATVPIEPIQKLQIAQNT
ncbi:Tetratricopeptide-like helical [Penicillium cataractarum]|uniref:Tetratricopeptide-like helical n=1 Tax=Penicillium cataractarum TaxID=2100454 RepID=A0A9W9VTR7_9EURO|nr:Tetratricopeptide-like helical [Penicillium cataractarum]KAJ5389222.1 Tetratricopeptide-like helical [Penicillium cataractarum]